MSTQFPLAYQQQWLWNLLWKCSDWKCVVSHAFRLRGLLDKGTLEKSIEEVIRRHGALRTRIVAVDAVAHQEVDEPCAYRLETVVVPGYSRPEIEARAQRLLEAFCDLKVGALTGPLMRLQVLQLADDEHWLLLGMHRLIADCASIDQVLREIWMLYGDLQRGEVSAPSRVPTHYGEYALWQQKTSDAWLKRHNGYWTERLSGAAHLQWPVDSGLAGVRHGTLGRLNHQFGSELSAQLRDLAKETRTLAAAAMLAVYVAVLWHWCGQRDFVIALKIAGRQTEFKSVIGYFPCLLYLRFSLSGAETFSELMNVAAGEFFRALAHQDFGRMSVREPGLLAGAFFQWITWRRDETLGHALPIAPPAQLTAERIVIRNVGDGLSAVPPGVVDVEVTFFDTEDGIEASGVYRADRFAASTMERFMADLHAATELFVRAPDAGLAAFAAQLEGAQRSVRAAR